MDLGGAPEEGEPPEPEPQPEPQQPDAEQQPEAAAADAVADASALKRMQSDAPEDEAQSLLAFARPMGIFHMLSEAEALDRCRAALDATPGHDIGDACDWLWDQEQQSAALDVPHESPDPPNFLLTPAELLWGIGEGKLGEQTQTLVLSNPGSRDACFLTKTSRKSRFVLSPSMGIIAAGASTEVQVTMPPLQVLPSPDDHMDRILLLGAWRGDPAEDSGTFWERWKGQVFHKHITSDLVLPEDAEPGSALSHTRTLSVDSYKGQEISVMFHGTDSRAAQLIASSQRFRPSVPPLTKIPKSVSGLLGDGVYVTRTRQKAEGYRVHHPNASKVGSSERNMVRPCGKPDPGCILQFRARLGACRTFTRETPREEFTAATWHEGAVLEPTSTLQAAANKAGVKTVRYNSAHSKGCPCCPEHGEDCPGSPENNHFVPEGVTPCKGRCKTGFRICPRANSAWEEFCIFNPARIDNIEIIDGPEELIGYGREFWGVERDVCDEAVRKKQAELEAEAVIATKIVEAAVKEQCETVVAAVISDAPHWLEKMEGVYKRVEDTLLKNERGWYLFYHQRGEWRISSRDGRETTACFAHIKGPLQNTIGSCLPSGSEVWVGWNGTDWVDFRLSMKLCGQDGAEEARQERQQARQVRLDKCAANAQKQLSDTAAVVVSGIPVSKGTNGTFRPRQPYKGWPCFHNGSVHLYYNLALMEWQIGRAVFEKDHYNAVRLSSADGKLPAGTKVWKVYDVARKQFTTCTVTVQLKNADAVDMESQQFEAEKAIALANALSQLRPVGAVVVAGCPNELCNGTFQHISPLARMSTPTPGWLRPRVKQEDWPRFENEHGVQLYNYHSKAGLSAGYPELHWRISSAPWEANPDVFAYLQPASAVHCTIENSGGIYDDGLVANLNTLIIGKGRCSELCKGDEVDTALRAVFTGMKVVPGKQGFAADKAAANEARRQFGALRGYQVLRPFLSESATPCAFLGACKIVAQSTINHDSNKDYVRAAGLLPLLGRYLHRIPPTTAPVTKLPRQPATQDILLESASAVANCVGNVPTQRNAELFGQLGYIETLIHILGLHPPSRDNTKLRYKTMLALKLCCRKDMLPNCARLLRTEDSERQLSAESCLKGSAQCSQELLDKTLEAAGHLREAIQEARSNSKLAAVVVALPKHTHEEGVPAHFTLSGHPMASLNGLYKEQGICNGCPLFRQSDGTGALYKFASAGKPPKWNFSAQYSDDSARRGATSASIGGEDDRPPSGCRVWRWCPPASFSASNPNTTPEWQDVELTLATTQADALIRTAYNAVAEELSAVATGHHQLMPGQLAVGTTTWHCRVDEKFSDCQVTTTLLSEDDARIAVAEIAAEQESRCEAALANARSQLSSVGAVRISSSGINNVDGMFVPSQQQPRGLCFENSHGMFLYNFCPSRLCPSRWNIASELGASTSMLYHAPRQEDYPLSEFLALCGLEAWRDTFERNFPAIKTAAHLRATPALELQRVITETALDSNQRHWARCAGCAEVTGPLANDSIEGVYRCDSKTSAVSQSRIIVARVDVESDCSVLISDRDSGGLIGEGRLVDSKTAKVKAYERSYTVTRVPQGLQWSIDCDGESPQCYRVAVQHLVVRKDCDRSSEQTGRLASGAVVVVIESRREGEQERVRLASGGWTSVTNLEGKVLLEPLGSLAELWVWLPSPRESSWPDIGDKLVAAIRDGPTRPPAGGGELPTGSSIWMAKQSSTAATRIKWQETRVTVQLLSVEEREAKLQKQRELKQATLHLMRKRAFDQVAALKQTGLFLSGLPAQDVASPFLNVTLDLASFNGKYTHTEGDHTAEGFPVWRLESATGCERFLYRRSMDVCRNGVEPLCLNSQLTPDTNTHWACPVVVCDGTVPLESVKWHVFHGSKQSGLAHELQLWIPFELTLASSTVPGEIAAAGAAEAVALLRQHVADKALSCTAVKRLKTLLTADDEDECAAHSTAAGDAGGCTIIVGWLQNGLDEADVAKLACSTLYNLAFKSPANRTALSEVAGPLSVIAALNTHRRDDDVMAECLKALTELGTDSPELCADIAAADGVPAIVATVKQHDTCQLPVVILAIKALIVLCDFGRAAGLRSAVVEAGGAEAVLAALRYRRFDAKLQFDGLCLVYLLTYFRLRI